MLALIVFLRLVGLPCFYYYEIQRFRAVIFEKWVKSSKVTEKYKAERKWKPRHGVMAGKKYSKMARNFVQSNQPITEKGPMRRLGPRARRVSLNIQHGFPVRQRRRVLCAKCCRSSSHALYFTVGSVSIVSVDIYSDGVRVGCSVY